MTESQRLRTMALEQLYRDNQKETLAYVFGVGIVFPPRYPGSVLILPIFPRFPSVYPRNPVDSPLNIRREEFRVIRAVMDGREVDALFVDDQNFSKERIDLLALEYTLRQDLQDDVDALDLEEKGRA